jgi:hypothetical protein
MARGYACTARKYANNGCRKDDDSLDLVRQFPGVGAAGEKPLRLGSRRHPLVADQDTLDGRIRECSHRPDESGDGLSTGGGCSKCR